MELQKVYKYAYYVIYFLLALLFFLIVLAVMVLEANKNPDPQKRFEKAAEIFSVDRKLNANLPDVWPPAMNKLYPELELVDQEGAEFKASDLKGKVVLVEYVDMNSPVSQAYSGAKNKGTLGGVSQTYDETVLPIEETIATETKFTELVTLPNPDLVMLKIIIYAEGGGQAGPVDAERWAQHFGFTREGGVIVAVPKNDIRDKKTDSLIPGFQLVSKEFELRVDSAGVDPKHNLRFRLVPMIRTLLDAEVE